jgi:hypothetical protein
MRKFFPQHSDKITRQYSKSHTCRIAGLQRPQIRSGPNKAIGFRHNDPRPIVIETKATFRSGWNFDRVFGGRRRRMRHGKDGNDLFPRVFNAHHHDRTRAILRTFLDATQMLGAPEVRVPDH